MLEFCLKNNKNVGALFMYLRTLIDFYIYDSIGFDNKLRTSLTYRMS